MLKWIKRNLLDWYDSDMNFGWNISNLWGKITHPFTRTWHWLVKSIQYSRLLWSDFDWDYSYILTLLKYKLKRTRIRIKENNMVVAAPVIANEILHVEKLIDKFMDDDFCAEEFAAHDEKWGEMKIGSKPTNNPQLLEMTFNRKNVLTEEDEEQEGKEFRVLLEKREKEKQECWDEIFDSMKKYMQGWWD